MGILYGMVARGQTVLTEFSCPTIAANAGAGAVARQILEKLRSSGQADCSASFPHGRHVFHVSRGDGLVVLCLADDALEKRIPFSFLREIRQRFEKTYGRAIHSAASYAMNEEFSRVLSREMERYSTSPDLNKLNQSKSGELTQVGTVMINKIEKSSERGDDCLALLEDRSCSFRGNAIGRFRRQSRHLKSTMRLGNFKLTGALLLVVAIIIYVVLAFLCGGPLMTSCLRQAFGVD